ncbi:MAG: APC family permease, partial [Ignavibacteriae bacterium]|nr:APC family permease [Ignavibacteriota bacterium]
AEGFMRAMFLLVFAYGGFEIVTIPSAESVDPKRHVPRALVASLAIIATFYCIVQVVAVGVLPTLASEERPIAAVAAIIMGNFGANLVAFGALVSTFGYFSGSILGVPRLTFALAEKKQLPSFFAAVHPKFQTPYISIIFYSVLTFLLAVFSDFITLAAVSVVSRLLYYITTSSAVIAFRRTSKAPFTIPFGPAIPLIGILIALYLFQYPTEKEVYFTAGGIAVGTILYFFVRRGERKQT